MFKDLATKGYAQLLCRAAPIPLSAALLSLQLLLPSRARTPPTRRQRNMSFASRAKGAGDAWRRFPMLTGCWKGFGPWPGLVYATGIFTAYLVAKKVLAKPGHDDNH